MTDTVLELAPKLHSLLKGQTTVLRGARLIDGSGRAPIDNVTLVIDGSRVVSCAPESESSRPSYAESASVIDCSGLTVMPGLIDCHTHLTGETTLDAIERYSPDVWHDYRTLVAAEHTARALASGFTTVRVLGHGDAQQVYALRRATAEGLMPGPRILTAGWAISQSGGHGDPHFLPADLVQRFRPRSAFADGEVGCRTMVRTNFGEGADCIKIYVTEGSLVGAQGPGRTVTNFTVDEISAMTDEAHSRGARVAAHATTSDGVRNAVAGGVDTVEHGGDLTGCPDLIDLMVERGVVLVPTMKVFEVISVRGPELGLPRSSVAAAATILKSQIAYLSDARSRGLAIACGSDSAVFEHGDNARELGLLVEAGFTPLEAIQAATSVSAQALGLEDDLGILEPGKLADAIILDTDPLSDIGSLRDHSNIRMILRSTEVL